MVQSGRDVFANAPLGSGQGLSSKKDLWVSGVDHQAEL